MKADKRLARLLAEECFKKLGSDIRLMDVRRKCGYSNYFLIVSCRNRMHIDALKSHIKGIISEKKISVYGMEGTPESGWVIIDLGAIIVHLFHPDMRSFYDIEGFWGPPKYVDIGIPEHDVRASD